MNRLNIKFFADFTLWKKFSNTSYLFKESLWKCSTCRMTTVADDSNDGRNRNAKQPENLHSTNHTLGMLKQKVSLDTKKPYKPPSDVRKRIEQIAQEMLSDSLTSDWESTCIADRAQKFKFLTRLMTEFQHDIPSSALTDMKTVGAAVEYFTSEVRAQSTFEDLAERTDLPQNLHIQSEYVRFDPETDTMFNGRTAFPGRDTHVTSIKYRRKYSSIKNAKEKPGFVNHYYGY